MDLEFDPDYIMQDAWAASYNAANKILNATILMCYFHVMYNIKKYKHLIPVSKFDKLLEDVRLIHWSKNENDYQNNIEKFRQKYQKKYELMYNYINNQWLSEPFNKWQIFRNNPGFANTNSNIESFNAAIKRDFTTRRRLSIPAALAKFREIVDYYSTTDTHFELIPECEKIVKEFSENITKKHFIKRGLKWFIVGKTLGILLIQLNVLVLVNTL